MLKHRQQEVLSHLGFDLTKIDSKPLGRGANHEVYKYVPEGESPKVIKLPKPVLPLRGASLAREKRDLSLVGDYFGPYVNPCEVVSDGLDYCLLSNFVAGSPVSQFDAESSNIISQQIFDLIAINKLLGDQMGYSLDFVGWEGGIDLLKRLSGFRDVNQRLGNIFLPDNFSDDGTLAIIDYDLIPLRSNQIPKNILFKFGYVIQLPALARFL